jgi:hypothetical protein
MQSELALRYKVKGKGLAMKKALAMEVAAGRVHAAAALSGWAGYGGAARVVLAVVLVTAAAGVVYAGIRLSPPIGLPVLGRKARSLVVAAWVFAIVLVLAGVGINVHQALRDHLFHTHPAPVDPITPVTLIGVGVIFFVICVASPRGGWAALTSAAIGAMAAPMVFEFPFDLVIMARTTPIPPDPALFRVVFFVPLFLVEATTLALLALSPMVQLSRAACFCFALMLAVFAVWGLSGFGYPSAPLPFALNVVSKILAFAAALCLFLPQRSRASARSAQVSVSPGRTIPVS